MALSWALAVLSLLPLLEAQNPGLVNLTALNPALVNLTVIPITNATLEQLSGRWFFIGSAFRNPEYKQEAQKIQADFFDFVPNLTEDTMLVQEYQTIEDKCIYTSSHLRVQRENGIFSKLEGDREHFALLLLPKDPKIFMLAFSLEDKQNRGLSFYAVRPKVTLKQQEEFEEAIISAGMLKSEITYVDWTKDLCGPLHRQKELEKKEENKEPKEDVA